MPHDPIPAQGKAAPPPLRVATVLGAADDPAYAARLHAMAHDGEVDVVWLPRADMARRRMVVRSAAGREVAIILPRTQSLFDGAVLSMSESAALVVRADAEQWLRLEPVSAEVALMLGYAAGNLHWRVRFAGAALLVALEAPVEGYLDRLGALRDRFTFCVEGAAA
jgi:urease accessory protein